MGLNTLKGTAAVVEGAKKAAQIKSAGTLASNGVKTAAAVEHHSQKLIGFTPQILEGNKKFGMAHVIKRHAFETPAKDVSRFLPGMGKKEIGELVNGACKNAKSWNISDKSGYYTAVVDTGKLIGIKRDCGSATSTIMVVLNGNILHTAYPF